MPLADHPPPFVGHSGCSPPRSSTAAPHVAHPAAAAPPLPPAPPPAPRAPAALSPASRGPWPALIATVGAQHPPAAERPLETSGPGKRCGVLAGLLRGVRCRGGAGQACGPRSQGPMACDPCRADGLPGSLPPVVRCPRRQGGSPPLLRLLLAASPVLQPAAPLGLPIPSLHSVVLPGTSGLPSSSSARQLGAAAPMHRPRLAGAGVWMGLRKGQTHRPPTHQASRRCCLHQTRETIPHAVPQTRCPASCPSPWICRPPACQRCWPPPSLPLVPVSGCARVSCRSAGASPPWHRYGPAPPPCRALATCPLPPCAHPPSHPHLRACPLPRLHP